MFAFEFRSNELELNRGIYYLIGILFVSGSCTNTTTTPVVHIEGERVSKLLKNVSIFNGEDSILQMGMDVLIVNGEIERIAGNIENHRATELIDGTGKTLMPGLIDAHVHLSGSGAVPWENVPADLNYNLSAYLYVGVTTVYDLGGLAKSIGNLAEKVAQGEIAGPRIFNTHIPITVKNSHPIPLTQQMLPWPLKSMVNSISPTIYEVEEAPALIEKYVGHNIDYVKIICDQIPPGSPQMNFHQLKALIDEAHAHGKKVFVHIGSPRNALMAIRAGADVLAHGIWRGELSTTQADSIAAAQIPIVYTLAGFTNVSCIHHGNFEPVKLDSSLIPDNVLSPVTGVNGKDVHHQAVMNEFFKDVSEHEEYWAENFKLLKSRGVRILVGTDSNLPGTYAGATYMQELFLLKEYGMSNYEVLKAATYLNSKIFLENPGFGKVEEGMSADILLLNGNPLENLEVLKAPEMIMARGQVVKRVE